MKLYRAIPKESYNDKSLNVYKRLNTKRAPSNIPYLVDNVWEFLRPDNYPSRRHAAYASPTKELALKNASAMTNSGFIVTEVMFSNNDYKIAHIPVTDARYHKDIKVIMNCVMSHFGKDFTNLSVNEKLKNAALFMPSVSKEELDEYFNFNENNKVLENKLKELSIFWKEAELSPQNHDGELFFELLNDCEYYLLEERE